jgi:hypothetical protein
MQEKNSANIACADSHGTSFVFGGRLRAGLLEKRRCIRQLHGKHNTGYAEGISKCPNH